MFLSALGPYTGGSCKDALEEFLNIDLSTVSEVRIFPDEGKMETIGYTAPGVLGEWILDPKGRWVYMS